MIPDPISLVQKPTPIHRLDRLSADLRLDLWIKRDDLTGFALGGNKGRKLEYLMADAVASGAEVVVTCGSLQSNFVRQLAAACSVLGIQCAAAVMALPYEFSRPKVPGLSESGGNFLLDRMLGADVRVYPDGTWDQLFAHATELAAEYAGKGRQVYEIPIGGACALGAYGFVQAGRELMEQVDTPFDWIVFASSSGSTHVGLQYAFHGQKTRVLGIAGDPEPDILDDFARVYESLENLTGEPRPMGRSEWRLDPRFVGPGYGVPSRPGNVAIDLLARREGIFLDPVYSGKAFAALTSMARSGEIRGRVLFWHTGGAPTLFAMPHG